MAVSKGNSECGKVGIVAILFILIFITIGLGASYVGVKLWWAKNQPRSQLTATKVSADVLHWSFRQLPELYSKTIALDDMISLLDNELQRLKELGKEYPDQQEIVAEESANLKEKRDELTAVLVETAKSIESIYVAYKIDVRKGQSKIGSKEIYDLGKKLTATLKSHSRMVSRIKSQNPEKWADKIKKLF